jgi:hypothetical protein
LENLKFFAFFFGKKNGLQKFQGRFYVLAALNGMLFGNPLQKFFCGFGFVEFLCGQPLCQKGLGVSCGRGLCCLFFVRFCVMIVRCRSFSERHGLEDTVKLFVMSLLS